MKVLSFSFFSDLIFVFVASFLLSQVFANYFLTYPLSLVLSTCFGLLCVLVAFKVFYTKKSKRINEQKNKELRDNILNQLCFYTKPALLSLFEKAYKATDNEVVKYTTHLFLPNKNQLIFLHFNFDGIVKADVVKAFNKLKKGQTALLIAQSFSDEVSTFASRFNDRINLLSEEETFSLLNESGLVPEIKCALKPEKKKRATIKNFFLKSNSKRYFWFGCLFLLLSFIVPFKLYYVIVGSALLILSLITKFIVKAV